MEHRKDKRFEERDRVLIRDRGRSDGQSHKETVNAHTYDLSVTGARICCKKHYSPGEVVHVVIDLERTEQFLKVDGRVIWSLPSQRESHTDIGVEFLHSIPDTFLALIKHFYGKNVAIPSRVS